MPSGPLTGNHPKTTKVYEVEGLIVTVTPDPRETWDRRNSYYFQVNGETRGKIAYLSGRWTRGWAIHSFMPALSHYGSSQLKSGQKTEVAAGKTFAECIKAIPKFWLEARLPTIEEVHERLAIIDAQNAEKVAQREREKADRQAAQDRAQAEAEAARLETLEGLRSIRDNLGPGLTNHEMSALKAAIVKFGGDKGE